jgi:hypothetical protein
MGAIEEGFSAEDVVGDVFDQIGRGRLADIDVEPAGELDVSTAEMKLHGGGTISPPGH